MKLRSEPWPSGHSGAGAAESALAAVLPSPMLRAFRQSLLRRELLPRRSDEPNPRDRSNPPVPTASNPGNRIPSPSTEIVPCYENVIEMGEETTRKLTMTPPIPRGIELPRCTTKTKTQRKEIERKEEKERPRSRPWLTLNQFVLLQNNGPQDAP